MNPSNSTPPKKSKSDELKSKSLYGKGESAFASCRLETAKAYLGKALESFRASGDAPNQGQCLLNLGRTLELMGEYPQARESYEAALKVFQSLGDRSNQSRTKALLGNLAWATGDYAEATRLLDEALFGFREIGDLPNQAWLHDLMGNLQLAMREDQQAERYYRTAFSLVAEKGENFEHRAWNQYHLGALALFRGDLAQAKERFSEALGHFNHLKDELGQVAALIHLGEVACDQKDHGEAQKHFQKAIQKVVPTQCRPLLADALTGVARLLKVQGDERKAVTLLMVALSHPTCRQQTKDRMVALSVALKAQFSPKEVEAGFRWAKAVSLEEMASSWVSAVTAKAKGGKIA